MRRVESSDIQSPGLSAKNKPHQTEHNLAGLCRGKQTFLAGGGARQAARQTAFRQANQNLIPAAQAGLSPPKPRDSTLQQRLSHEQIPLPQGDNVSQSVIRSQEDASQSQLFGISDSRQIRLDFSEANQSIVRKRPQPRLPKLSTYLTYQSAPEIIQEVRKLQ